MAIGSYPESRNFVHLFLGTVLLNAGTNSFTSCQNIDKSIQAERGSTTLATQLEIRSNFSRTTSSTSHSRIPLHLVTRPKRFSTRCLLIAFRSIGVTRW